MKKPTLFFPSGNKSNDEIRHDAMAMDLVRRIVLDYLQPGGLSAQEAINLLVPIIDPGDRLSGLCGLQNGKPENDNEPQAES